MTFGHIEGYPVGSTFDDRWELSKSGVHRPPQAGISGNKEEGAESIVLSGGYEDDRDWGDEIVYTGQGGRDPKTGKQNQNQPLTRGNRALVLSMQRGLPVRVIRGAHPEVHEAPTSGYRYDGLYRVEGYWSEPGQSGFLVWRFRLVRFERTASFQVREEQAGYDPVSRAESRAQRIVRSSAVAEQVKKMHKSCCQVCGERLNTAVGPYAEAAHVRPLGHPHDGPDTVDNVLCLCPNHHVLFDYYRFAIADDFELIGLGGHLRTHASHRIDPAHLQYHRSLFFAAAHDV